MTPSSPEGSQLRDEIAEAIAEADGRSVDLKPLADLTYHEMADTALCVVQPELDRLTAEVERLRREEHIFQLTEDGLVRKCNSQEAELMDQSRQLHALSGLLRGMARRVAEVRQSLRFADAHVPQWERVISDHKDEISRLRAQLDKAVVLPPDAESQIEAWLVGRFPSSLDGSKSRTAARGVMRLVRSWAALDELSSQGRDYLKPTAIELITAERARQVDVEGWTPEHDAEHDSDDLARAAACYALPRRWRDPLFVEPQCPPKQWPWEGRYWKPTPADRVRELVKSGALIAAEIDRIRRQDAAVAARSEATPEGPLTNDSATLTSESSNQQPNHHEGRPPGSRAAEPPPVESAWHVDQLVEFDSPWDGSGRGRIAAISEDGFLTIVGRHVDSRVQQWTVGPEWAQKFLTEVSASSLTTQEDR